ncbi:substrate-binding domain-containing protein [Sphingopyxis sp. PET50]|uniref:substrate-binding domain-containing protein n=1 Tax=Sphingopyxis sp. PET50 TaxID=2976533 RepID=UPI0021B00493|nr:substrate-binding domain-containing protein [Sphingopyxis sp. PET50]
MTPTAASPLGHFVATGRRRPAFVGPADSAQRQFDERREGFAAALGARDVTPVVWAAAAAADRHAQGVAAARALLGAHPDIDAIFAASDMLALGVLQGLKEAGRRVPHDVALIGFDGIRAGDARRPRAHHARARSRRGGRGARRNGARGR